MRCRMVICALATAALMGGLSQSAWGTYYAVSCEGTACGGGRNYEYGVQNAWTGPELLRLFYIGTDDLNVGNYSNWLTPPGFSVQVAPSGTLWFMGVKLSMPGTEHIQLPHGAMAPINMGPSTIGVVVWTNETGTNILPGQVLTFGFDNPNTYQDTEWVAASLPGQGDAAQFPMTAPIVGPAGVYGLGLAHAPAPEPATLSLLAVSGILLLKRRRKPTA